MKKLKYLHVAHKITPQMAAALDEVPRRGGMFNWMFAFKGQMSNFNDMDPKDYENFDVIQVNLSSADFLLVREIRKALGRSSSTMLVANNDFVSEKWKTFGVHPIEYLHIQEQADMVFGTEPYQTSQLIDGAFCLPHPHWIKMYKHIRSGHEKEGMGVIFHWWEGKTQTAYQLLHRLRSKYPMMRGHIFGYGPNQDEYFRYHKVMFDVRYPLIEYKDFLDNMMRRKFVVDFCHCHTYGRTTVDTAAMRIPTIASDRIYSGRICWPNASCDPMDLKKAREIALKWLENKTWAKEQLDIAQEKCEYFNYKNSMERYITALEKARKRPKNY